MQAFIRWAPAVLVISAVIAQSVGQSEDAARLKAPSKGKIPVAFVVAPGVTVIDFTGPWEVFQDVMVPGRGESASDTMPFQLYTVAESRAPIRASAGLQIVPDYTFDDAPAPKVIVVGAQPSSTRMLEWLRTASVDADLTMSVCTGAFVLAKAGLLDGRVATTHHDFVNQLQRAHPNIDVRRELRYVEGPRIATAGGLTSGIDLALRVVARYFGEETAERTARYMEYTSQGWRKDGGIWDSSEPAKAEKAGSAAAVTPVLGGLDPVLLTQGQQVKGRKDLMATRGNYHYIFAGPSNRQAFLADPHLYEIQLGGACAYMAKNGASAGSGDPDRFFVFNRRIYIFATENCRDSFKLDPPRYLEGPTSSSSQH